MMTGMRESGHDHAADLQEKARQHLWLHFARMGPWSSGQAEIPIFVRGEGVRLFDDKGRRYLDGLSGLFTVQVGHGGPTSPPPAPAKPSSSPTTRSGRRRIRPPSSSPLVSPRSRRPI
jgi:hypothetical protein